MPELPQLGAPPTKKPGVLLVVVIAAAVGLLAGGLYWFLVARKASSPPTPVPVAQPVTPPQPTPPPPVKEPLEAAGLRLVKVTVDGPLETALTTAVGKELGLPLTQVTTRSLVWWVQVPNDLQRGDTVDVLFQVRQGEEPLVHAVRLASKKHGKTFEAFRFKRQADRSSRLFDRAGVELEERLNDAPLDEYEQITSLLRDGRRHKGVDFKTPIGTPVKATFAGTVTRRNWAFRANGNSLEIAEHGGKNRRAIYLHLSELPGDVKVGSKVEKGRVIAQSGNTGRSFAPHLHYQLMGPGDRVLDPFDSHGSTRSSLPPADRAAFDKEVQLLEGLLAQPPQ